MKKWIMLSFFITMNTYANGFDGCGEYQFRGVAKLLDQKSFKLIYVVNEGTKSQMIFDIKNQEDIDRLSPSLNRPSIFKGSILKIMDGTKGALEDPTAIGFRLPNPLAPNDTGITKISSKKCSD
jgi:hypothetical protein